jgi:thymidine phosphorylase
MAKLSGPAETDVHDVEKVKQLGRVVIRVAKSMNRTRVGLITNTNKPLGSCVKTGLAIQQVLRLFRGESNQEVGE